MTSIRLLREQLYSLYSRVQHIFLYTIFTWFEIERIRFRLYIIADNYVFYFPTLTLCLIGSYRKLIFMFVYRYSYIIGYGP